MTRRRQERWIYRWSRWLISGVAALGALETAYLTWAKLTGAAVACPVEGCDRVLDSTYAAVFGLPLPLFGLLAYGSVLALAALPLAFGSPTQTERRQQLEAQTWPLLFGLTLAMVVFSGYLMYVMAFELKALCPYCLASALFSLTLLVLTLSGRLWEDVGQLLFNGAIVGVITLTGLLALYSPAGGSRATASVAGSAGPPITQPSGPSEVALAKHLEATGAKMYGAWWCPHCYDQKALFGAEAATQLPYVECAADGKNPQTDLCRAQSQVTGFPTWQINGSFYSGTQTLEQLADLSGYSGPKTFRQ
jgi:uncharacterized membrane protein